MKTILFLGYMLLKSSFTFAQDQEINFKAQHGGVLQATKKAVIEVVKEKDRTSIYITGHDRKNLNDQKLSLAAIARIGGKDYPLQLSYENDHYSASPANTYMKKEKNYVLMLTITLPTGGTERALFNLTH